MTTVVDHSLVSSTKQDQRYAGLCAAEHLSYGGLGHGAPKPSDLGNFIVCQKLLEKGDSADIDSVLFVSGIVNPFEIGDDAISLHPIDMIDHGKVCWVGNEGQGHQSVNVYGLATSVSKEIDVSVSQLVSAGAQNFPVHYPRLQSVTDAVEAAHASEVTHLVKITEVSDRNRSPFFCEDDIHSTGCPSGEIGLAIKSPSYVLACGGLAFMAPASTIFNTLQ